MVSVEHQADRVVFDTTHVDTINEKFDIHKVTCSMAYKYISNMNMFLLVVILANRD